MIHIGTDNTLTIVRQTQFGLYLEDQDGNEVLLPNKYVPRQFEIGQEVTVFVYLDHEQRPVATTLEPFIYINEFALLRVSHTNDVGAFLGWGLEKDLFVPFREQARKMETGKRYLVYLYLDEKTNRLVASSKTNQFLSNDDLKIAVGDEVDLIISHITDAGINVIVNERYKGLMYKNEVYDDSLKPGDRMTGYVKNIRPDNKLDISLTKPGYEHVEPSAQKVLEELQANRGFLRLNDDSHPEDIKSVLKMSKKTFKKAIGLLYKEKKIEIKEDGIHLLDNP
jgi:predicted RNA-binding protein (virulence factor B family)